MFRWVSEEYYEGVMAQQLLVYVMWQGINMVTGFNLDNSGSSCVLVLWTAP